MKKWLILLVMALVVALASPVMAGPFVDVPEGHWAYDALQKMADRGFIEGYPDNTFQGKRPITRYEVAIIVARLVDTLEKKIGEMKVVGVPKKEEEKVEIEPGKFASIEEFNEFKSTVTKLASEFQDELAAIGVRLTTLEEGQAALKEQMAGVGALKMSGSIRIRGARKATELSDFFKRSGYGTLLDQDTRLAFVSQTTEDTKATVSFRARNMDMETGLFVNTPSIVCYEGWGTDAVKEIKVDEAKVETVTEYGTITGGLQYFQLGPIGLLVHDDNQAQGMVKVEREQGAISLTGIAGLLKGNDKYAAGRVATKIGEEGEVGVNVLLRGAGSAKNSYGVDVKTGPITAEVAQYKENDEKATAIVVSGDVLKNEKMSLTVKGASIDGEKDDATFNPTCSIMSVEDVDPIMRAGFKGIGVTGTYKVGKDITITGLACKGDDDSPTGMGILTVSKPLSSTTTASATFVQVGQKKASRDRVVRGELMIKF